MGFKGKDNLTSLGYKNKHKQKRSMKTAICINSKLYKQFKIMYDKLIRKYPSDQDLNSIGIIMGRSSMAARVTPQSNRELALLDIDKQVSLSAGALKLNDIRFSVMRLVLQNSQHSRFQRSDRLLQDTRFQRFARGLQENRQRRRNQFVGNDILGLEIQRRERRNRLERERLERHQLGREQTWNIVRRNQQVQPIRVDYLRPFNTDQVPRGLNRTNIFTRNQARNLFGNRQQPQTDVAREIVNNGTLNNFDGYLQELPAPPTGIFRNIFENIQTQIQTQVNIFNRLGRQQRNERPDNIFANNLRNRQEQNLLFPRTENLNMNLFADPQRQQNTDRRNTVHNVFRNFDRTAERNFFEGIEPRRRNQADGPFRMALGQPTWNILNTQERDDPQQTLNTLNTRERDDPERLNAGAANRVERTVVNDEISDQGQLPIVTDRSILQNEVEAYAQIVELAQAQAEANSENDESSVLIQFDLTDSQQEDEGEPNA